jgi:hypothetical protein
MKRTALAVAVVLLAGLAGTLALHARPGGVDDGPQFNGNALIRPADYREWIFLSAGLGMSYRPPAEGATPAFDNVFVNPSAYRSFLKTGTWPDGTVLVLEIRNAQDRG